LAAACKRARNMGVGCNRILLRSGSRPRVAVGEPCGVFNLRPVCNRIGRLRYKGGQAGCNPAAG